MLCSDILTGIYGTALWSYPLYEMSQLWKKKLSEKNDNKRMSISEIELTSKKVFNPTHFLYNETCVGLFLY